MGRNEVTSMRLKGYVLKMNKNKNSSAFTIIELLIVIVIIGILVAITAVAYTGVKEQANVAATNVDLANFKKALEVYALRNDNTFPDTKAQMTEAGLGGMVPKMISFNQNPTNGGAPTVKRGEYAVEVLNSTELGRVILFYWNYEDETWWSAVYLKQGNESISENMGRAALYDMVTTQSYPCKAPTLNQCGPTS